MTAALVITILIIMFFWCCFTYFYIEDFYRTSNSKPISQSFLEAIIQTFMLLVSLYGFYIIYLC